ncbi:MAG: Mth938-like domain-containing protein [Pseudomonadota bacterium]|nr:Mth938-like domain-containing protein [Pseudomonadota bacterium]
MTLHLQFADHVQYQITHYNIQGIVINQQHYKQSLIVMPHTLMPWPVEQFEHLTQAHFEMIVTLAPEVVLFGSGQQLRFPSSELFMPLINAGIGVEVMDTYAACRTYTILGGEQRQVAAALII